MLYNPLIWQQLNFYQSAEITQKFLHNCYKKSLIEKAEMKSYENCYPFMYFLQHGEIYYSQAEKAPTPIKPVLLFYGLIHLIKACLLTVDPNYPETTSVLAHGVSSRKKKKQQYQFMNDEIKIQKMGLCSHFANKMFHVKHLEGEKILMRDLFFQIPELDDCFSFNQETNMIHINSVNKMYYIPKKVLDRYHLTFESFIRFLKQNNSIDLLSANSDKHNLILQTIDHTKPSLPFRYHMIKKNICLPNKLTKYMFHPELIIHYLLLYNLSMIARYETEWWCELLKTTPTNDYPFIKTFLSITANKSPFLILQFLKEMLLDEY
ncbi:YaaC family protein [Heyndrickxia sp. NPDC080065]|uniref:YaaC family protein n=1 Tax=Heyndrickxia sp. NPDC080065 TaxID=3390568 RepID=UPI003D015A51